MKRAIDNAASGSHAGRTGGTIDVEDLPSSCFFAHRRRASRDRASPTWSSTNGRLRLVRALRSGEAPRFARSLTLAGTKRSRLRRVSLDGPIARTWASATRGRAVWPSRTVPRPVTELAKEILGPLGARVRVARRHAKGRPSAGFDFPTSSRRALRVDAIRDLIEREPKASLAVLGHDTDTARRCYELCSRAAGGSAGVDGISPSTRGSTSPTSTRQGARVRLRVVPDASAEAYPMTDDARRRLHVAVDRTATSSGMSGGTPSPSRGLPPETLAPSLKLPRRSTDLGELCSIV